VLKGVDLDLERGAALGLVGESGSGKTTLLLSLLGFLPLDQGTIQLDGEPMPSGTRPRRSREQRRRIQPVFQSALESLNPRLKVGSALAEPPRVHGIDPSALGASRLEEIPTALLELVGLDGALAGRYPRELSGGERQRVAIARAISVQPEALLLDEPVSALDLSVQAGVLELLARLRRELGMAILFVSHDLAVVEEVCDRVHVFHQGQIVESGSPGRILSNPGHLATERLVEAIPRVP
jgi:peptide/nickel transport system ATP-binding protein